MKPRCALAVSALLSLSAVWCVRGSDSRQTRSAVRAGERVRTVQLALMKERARLLAEDRQLADLNGRIQDLCRRLDTELSRRPTMRELMKQLRIAEREFFEARDGSEGLP